MNKKLKIVHLFNFHKGSRYPAMISQGLYFHPDVEVSYAMPFVSLGEVIQPADKDLSDSMRSADYIFRCNDQHFCLPEIDMFLDNNNLWSKVVYYDFKDSCEIDNHRLEQCAAYVKRSWSQGYDRIPIPKPPAPVLPMDFGLLNEFFVRPIPKIRDIDICYLFLPDKRIGNRRYNVFTELDKQRSEFSNPVIGTPTTMANVGRRAIFDTPDNNPFLDYLDILKRSKIVFTAYPDNWDGDSRTWEAFSSGALVFKDISTIPSHKPFLTGVHCFDYDARKPESIREAITIAKYFLENEKVRVKIAKEGYKYALTNHKPEQRITKILSWLQSPSKDLEKYVNKPRYFQIRSPIDFMFPSPDSISDKPKPNFIGIGAQKAGTTWLYENLKKHPQVFMNNHEKELHFFDTRHIFGLSRYLKKFKTSEGRMCGEITPSYMTLLEEEVAQIAEIFPEIKIFFIIRNPVERTWSGAKMEMEREIVNIDFLEDLKEDEILLFLRRPEIIVRSDYIHTIKTWRKYFSDTQFRVFLYDDIKKNPETFLRSVFTFLGVDSDIDLSEFPVRSEYQKSITLKLPTALHKMLREIYAPKITELEEMLSIDLSGWREP